MIRSILKRVLCRRKFYRFNLKLHSLSLHGMGLLNYENDTVTGQRTFLERFAKSAGNLQSEITIVDVGANVGSFSANVRQILPNSVIYALEPHPVTFMRLKQEAVRSKFKAVECGCSESVGTMTIYDRDDDGTTEHASLYREVIEELHNVPSRSFEINLIALDEFIRTQGLNQIHLLKIDTEGHEYSVLLGAQEAIRKGKIDVIQFEFNEMNIISRTFFRDFWQLLKQYDFYRMLPDGLVKIDHSPMRSELFGFQNIVAVRKEAAVSYVF